MAQKSEGSPHVSVPAYMESVSQQTTFRNPYAHRCITHSRTHHTYRSRTLRRSRSVKLRVDASIPRYDASRCYPSVVYPSTEIAPTHRSAATRCRRRGTAPHGNSAAPSTSTPCDQRRMSNMEQVRRRRSRRNHVIDSRIASSNVWSLPTRKKSSAYRTYAGWRSAWTTNRSSSWR